MGDDGALRILAIDDDTAILDVLVSSFEAEGHAVEPATDGRAGLQRAMDGEFDVVLLDVALGSGPNGHDVCRALRERHNLVPVIMLTALASEADAVQGLEAGADDYVSKPVRLAELRSRIRAVLRRTGRERAAEEVLEAGPIRLDRTRREVTLGGEPARLTFSEFELLAALLEQPGRLLSRQQLLRAMWGESAYRDPRAIDVHVRHLREKLEARPEQPELILTVRGAGYRFAG
jgi:two-component system, OmpR family, response regulator RegX3